MRVVATGTHPPGDRSMGVGLHERLFRIDMATETDTRLIRMQHPGIIRAMRIVATGTLTCRNRLMQLLFRVGRIGQIMTTAASVTLRIAQQGGKM